MPDPQMTPATIQSIRAAHGWTLAEMAGQCGVNIRTVQKWVGGERPPSPVACAMLRRLAADAERPAKA